jgi:uncharacterized protein (DUF58 family)
VSRGLTEANRARAVAHLRLDVARRLDALRLGDVSGHRPGEGSELDGVRAYRPGDDVRRMDWAVTARTGEATVRTTIAEHALDVTLVIDLTPSMQFGTTVRTKAALAAVVAAAVAHLSSAPGNSLRAVLVHESGTLLLGPGRSDVVIGRALRRILDDGPPARTPDRTAATPGTDPVAVVLRSTERSLRTPGLVVLVTDLIDRRDAADGEVDPWWPALRLLGARHELLVVEVVDPRELDLPAVGQLHLVDPESGAELLVNTSDRRVRQRYSDAVRTRRAQRHELVRRTGATHLQVSTDRDWLRDLARHLVQRRRARGAARPVRRSGGA